MRWSALVALIAGCAMPADDVGRSQAELSSVVGWSYDAGVYTNQDELHGSAVGLHIQSFAPVDNGRLAMITRDQVDLRAPGNAQNGPGVIGLEIGVRGTAQDPVWVDTGTETSVDGMSGLAKFMGIALYTPYVYWNGQGTLNTNGGFAAIGAPHTGIGSDGATCLPWVATYWTDGAPDINPSLSICDPTQPGGGSFGMRINGDSLYVGEDLVWGQPTNGTGSYEDCASGSTAPVSQSGHIRRGCDTTTGTMGFTVNVDGDPHWQPLPVAMQGQFNAGTGYGETTTAYPPGETIVHQIVGVSTRTAVWTPNDAKGDGDHGLRSWEPHRWNLPPQQAVTGGVLKACLRFTVASGSYQTFCNTTGAAVQTSRDSLFLAFRGTWITEVEALAVNTSNSTTPAMDIGLIQYEGTAF